MKTRTWILGSASLLATLVAAPALAQTPPPVVVQPAPQDPEADAAVLDEVVVTGLRRSLQSAQAIRRNSDQIVDAIVAEDIGKLPDTTASDSLARVTGVQVSRSGGEANQVLVRGLPDLTTTYNGRDIFTAETRFVAIQDFPAGGVAALEVFKSTTPEQIEGGIAGLINVRSRRPFDFAELEIAGSINATYAEQSGQNNYNGNLLISDRWDTGMGEFGALLNVSYTQLDYLDSARFNGGFIPAAGAGQVADPADAGFRYPDAVGIFYGQSQRTRPSVNAALQWRPTEALELYADFLYQGYRDEVEDRRLLVPLYGSAVFSNIELVPGTNQAQSLTVSGAVRPWMFQGATDRKTDTYQFAVGGAWNSGPWRISADLARTDSEFELSLYSLDSEFNTNPVFDVNFDVPREDGGVEFSFQNFDITNPANYLFLGIFDRYQTAEGDDVQFRTDAEYQTGFSLVPEIQFGVRYSDRNGSFQAGERFGGGGGIPLNTPGLGLDLQLTPEGFNGSSVQQTRRWISATRDSIRNNIAAIRSATGLADGTPPIDPFTVFDANEKAYTAYGQFRYALDTAFPIDGVIGLRAVRTDLSIDGTARTFPPGGGVVFTPRSQQSEYTDYLPSATFRMKLNDQVQVRLAANKTRTRPNFNQLNPTINVDPNEFSPGVFNASGGNPDLQPLESNNYDATVEYYFSPTGFASFGLFRRDIDGFIVNQIETVEDPELGTLRLNRPVNLNESRLQGVEVQLTTFLDYDFVPEWAHGFGLQVNGTYIEQEGAVINGISKYSYNVVALYEQGPFSARLAYNSRTEFQNFCEINGPFNSGCEYTDDVSRLDFAASYRPVENVTIAFDVSNILGEPFRSFRDYGDPNGPTLGTFARDVRFEETIYSLGLRFRY